MTEKDRWTSVDHLHHGQFNRGDPNNIILKLGIREGMKVVDLGSGVGFYSIPISREVGTTGRVFATDIDLDSLKAVRKKVTESGYQNISVLRCSIDHLPIKENEMDVVFLANVFHDIEDKKSLLSEIGRVIKREGFVVDLDWSNVPTEHGPPLHIRISESAAVKIFESSGFKLIKSMRENGHYVLIFTLDYRNKS
ncbi:MAG: methyltransferase domain-containing protein [Thermoplasmatales archaeon]